VAVAKAQRTELMKMMLLVMMMMTAAEEVAESGMVRVYLRPCCPSMEWG
jgi:hypothetical protein